VRAPTLKKSGSGIWSTLLGPRPAKECGATCARMARLEHL